MTQQINIQKLIEATNNANANARVAVQKAENAVASIAQLHAQNAQLKDALSRVQMFGRSGDPNIQRIENIPGRRIPFDLFVEIALPAGSAAARQGTVMIPQHGPFVAVRRTASLLSAFQFQVTPEEGGTVATFQGRSFGRWRPISSVCDVNDGQPTGGGQPQGEAFPGTGAPYIQSPSNLSPFRTMEGDFRIEFVNQGSSIPRQNIPISSSFYNEDINRAFDLGALDFFERGEVLAWNVIPTHPNNPSYGNLSGYGADNNLPYIDSQYDAIEGILDDHATSTEAGATDLVTRVPNAILQIGFHGYMIWQPAGAGPY